MINVGEAKPQARATFCFVARWPALFLSLAVVVAITAMVQTGIGLVGALCFPVGFVILSVMGYDPVTGVFGLRLWRSLQTVRASLGAHFPLLGSVGLGNLIGSLIVAYLVAISLTGNFL